LTDFYYNILKFIVKSKLARHVSGNNFAHLQGHWTVQYSLWCVIPNTLQVGDLVTKERFRVTDRV